MELILSGFAILISITSVVWSARSSRTQRQAAAVATNHTSIINIESMIAKVPQVLRFHGVEDPEQELKQHGMTSEEFAYLLGSFTLGGTYYRTAPEARAGIRESSYRHNMCRAPATRRAWPLLRRLITKSPYRDRLDEVFAQLDHESPLNTAAQNADGADQPSAGS